MTQGPAKTTIRVCANPPPNRHLNRYNPFLYCSLDKGFFILLPTFLGQPNPSGQAAASCSVLPHSAAPSTFTVPLPHQKAAPAHRHWSARTEGKGRGTEGKGKGSGGAFITAQVPQRALCGTNPERTVPGRAAHRGSAVPTAQPRRGRDRPRCRLHRGALARAAGWLSRCACAAAADTHHTPSTAPAGGPRTGGRAGARRQCGDGPGFGGADAASVTRG